MTNQSGPVMKDQNACHRLKKGSRGQRALLFTVVVKM